MPIDLTSTSFLPGATIPKEFTGDGADRSPPLRWTAPPSGTRSLALICDDPDAPRGTWVHWVLFNIPADCLELPEGAAKTDSLESGVKQGRNDFGKIGYDGPAPPRGQVHRYFFKIYALDFVPSLSGGVTKAKLLEAIKGHILAEGHLMGTYERF